jgi:hypothetical protein
MILAFPPTTAGPEKRELPLLLVNVGLLRDVCKREPQLACIAAHAQLPLLPSDPRMSKNARRIGSQQTSVLTEQPRADHADYRLIEIRLSTL